MAAAEAEESIAIIGMSGRFPGARNTAELWSLLESGAQARTILADEQLRESGIAEQLLSNPKYVKSCMKLAEPEYFDARFFGYSPSQALSIDPQQRLFLECAWEALESAGYCLEREPVSVGVFGGSGFSGHLLSNLQRVQGVDPAGFFQCVIDADKDYLTNRVAYKLGLSGPSITVQTACSTSLVAVHLACRSLLDFECDMALAGGASVSIPQEAGYLHIEGGTFSSDGQCRAFDAAADGTVPGHGVGVVALRRLKDALANGDEILAVIRSTVVNNDGARKVGYTAPGLHGQIRLLATALALADLHPQDISMFEAHGTGTFLGDAIELEALNEVYRSPDASRYCALGSLKASIGHLDAAAGVAGLIKAVLCLKHRSLVAMPNFSAPHPLLAAVGSPFYVNTELRPWNAANGQPRRAAVSAFGIGGTNAHAIVEEAPERIESMRRAPTEHIFPLSARDPDALHSASRRLAEFIQAHPNVDPVDVAYTLQVGRRRFECRRTLVASDLRSVGTQLLRVDVPGESCIENESSGRPVVLLFPGQGSEQAGMIAQLCRSDDSFKQDIDRCADRAAQLLGLDIRPLLCNDAGDGTSASADTLLIQPALFASEYAIARLLMRLGIRPAAVIGHSFGEYAAACIAGIISLEAAMQLVTCRARLTSQLPAGAMIVTALSEARARELIGQTLDIAAVNSDDQCVLSGESDAVRDIALVLEKLGVSHHRLPTARAFHSRMMVPAAEGLLEAAARLIYRPAKIPFVSSVTGKTITGEQVLDAHYWVDHLLTPVRFRDALAVLAQMRGAIFVEAGPGRALTSMARRSLGHEKSFTFMACLGGMGATAKLDVMKLVGNLWSQGADIEWYRLHEGGNPRRLSLPTYPFNRRPYALPRRTSSAAHLAAVPAATSRVGRDQWFYLPSWKRSMPPQALPACEAGDVWLVLADPAGLGGILAARLKANGHRVVLVQVAERFIELAPDSFCIDLKTPADYEQLFKTLQARACTIRRVVHCWSLSSDQEDRVDTIDSRSLELGYFSLLFLVQALTRVAAKFSAALLVVSNELQDISGTEPIDPAKAAIPALCKIIAQEFPGVRCAVVDLPAFSSDTYQVSQYVKYADRLLADAAQSAVDPMLAYRGNLRFVQSYEPVALDTSDTPVRVIRRRGFYVITGGLGHIGLALAQRLAREHQARLLLLTRMGTAVDASVSQRVREIEAAGAQVLVSNADLCNPSAIEHALEHAEQRFGQVHGVFHLAADLKHRSISRSVVDLDVADLQAQLRPKLAGLQALVAALQGRTLDFGIAFSSNSAILGGMGFGAYAAANAMLDSFVTAISREHPYPWLVLNWDGWIARDPAREQTRPAQSDPYALTMEEGLDALWQAIERCVISQVIVSACPFEPRLATWMRQLRTDRSADLQAEPEHPVIESTARDIRADYVAPRTDLEQTVADLWKQVLGMQSIGVEDNFLDLGGDSLIGLRIISRVRDVFAVNLSVSLLIGPGATIAAMVTEIVIRKAALHDRQMVDDTIARITASG